MVTEDFSSNCIDQMVDVRHSLVTLASHMLRQEVEGSLAHHFACQVRAGNPYDGHTLSEQPEQASILSDARIKDVSVDLGYRGVDPENPAVRIKDRGRFRSQSD